MATALEADDLVTEIRRAAFELRQDDPHEAVRVLRRLMKTAGPAEPLVHGALGEILLDDFDDVDGALHHFRRLVALAPELPAGHIGLARALGRNGEAAGAQTAYHHAQRGLASMLAQARATPEADHPGADEAMLAALELALEERELLREVATATAPAELDAGLLAWAEASRLFDAEEGDDPDDWVRYARLRAALQAGTGDTPAALATVERVAALARLPADRVAYLRSCAHEAADDLAAAASAAREGLGDLEGAFEAEEVLRAASLLGRSGSQAAGAELLDRLRLRLERERARADPAGRAAIDALLEEVRTLAAGNGPKLVSIGLAGRRP